MGMGTIYQSLREDLILTLKGGISDTLHFIGIKDTKDKVRLEWVTGGPPLTRFSLSQIPLPQFLAYVRASG